MSEARRQVLVVEDNPGDARLLREMLNEPSMRDTRLVHFSLMAEAEAYLAANRVDVALLDLGLADAQGIDVVRRARRVAPRLPLVVFTGMDDESLAAHALRQGAQDYIVKGQIEARSLSRALNQAMERKLLEDTLLAEKERAEVTLNSIADAVGATDLEGKITFINAVAETLTGWTLAEAVGHPVGEVIRIIDATTRKAALDPLQQVTGRRSSTERPPNSVLVRRNGVDMPVEESVAPIHDHHGRTYGAVVVFRDVSDERTLVQQMAHSARHDVLTALPNRMLLNDRIDNAIAIAPRHRKRVAVLFLDLDGFKSINDTLGHPVGDKLLQSIAKRLVGCVRTSDTVSRLGGDEFVVLLSEVEQAEDAAVLARRILEAVAEPHFIDEHELHVTASIGVSICPDDGTDAAALIRSADTAMYQAKQGGRHRYQFFEPVMNRHAVERQSTEEALVLALKRDEFTLVFQPKIDLWTGEVAGAEVLIRWVHPTQGVLLPARFIPVAEACGLIQSIGQWAMREACTQAQTWLAAGFHLPRIAVNVRAAEFRDDAFLAGVCAALDDTGLDPTALELELTEGVVMRHAESAAPILHALRERGVRLAVDDFGTGYSSLSYLRKFPIDTLKVDQSLVRQIGGVGRDTSLITAVLAMARSLRLRVVANGVETQRELSFLQAHRCDEAQGHFFSEPLPADQFGMLLRSGIASTIATRLFAGKASSAAAPVH